MAGVNRNGTVFGNGIQLFGYSEDIEIVRHAKRDFTAVFSTVERDSADMGLLMN